VQDGLGHLVRSLCVLRELAKQMPVHLLLLGDSSGSHLVHESGIPWAHCTSDEDAASRALEKEPKVVVFDMLAFDAKAFDRIAAASITVSLSPTFSQMTKVHHLFHRTVNEHPSWAAEAMFPKVHKGFQYAVLPSWLRRITTAHYREHLEEHRLGVAISMGGTDAPNVTLSLLQRFGRVSPKLVIWVALGDAYTHSYAELLECAARNRQEIILLKSNDSMWRVLRNASLLVCSGGLTTYEAAFIGLPTINLIRRRDWGYLFDELAAHGACYTIPPHESSLDDAVRMVTDLERDREHLLRIHLATRDLIPDGGALRIANKLDSLHREGLL
jgi:spore coat polysaccharide biosynthesis predicted glycosyltransferase SpsG